MSQDETLPNVNPKNVVRLEDYEIGSNRRIWYGNKINMNQPQRKPSRLSYSLAALILLALCYVIYQAFVSPLFISGFGLADTRPVPGDSRHFDPIAAYPVIVDYAGGKSNLVSIFALYVRSDGTLDLNASYRPYVTYEFYREMDTPPADAPPVGAGGTVSGTWYEPVQIRAYEPGQWRRVSGGGVGYTYMNQGMERDTSSPTTNPSDEFVDMPVCSFKQLWDVALTKDAPKDAVATIEYDIDGYEFRISDTSISLEFDFDCQLKGDDSSAPAPAPAPTVEPAEEVPSS
jgi:hypothetical protein